MAFSKFKVAEKQAALAVDFLVVGGDIAGLACAIALRRVGHRVTVLEQDDADMLNRRRESSGPCRMPPNLTKILYHWGLADEVRSIAIRAESINLLLYESGEFLGTQHWDEEVLRETRGEFVFTQHSALRHLLYELALFCGAVVRLDAKVSWIDSANQTVTLAGSEEQLRADVIIGADGLAGLTRHQLHPSAQEQFSLDRLNMYSTTVRREAIMGDPDLAFLYIQNYTTMFNWFGDGRSVLGFPIGDGSEFGLYIYGPASDVDHGTQWDHGVSRDELVAVLATAEARLQKLGPLVENVTCTSAQIHPHAQLEQWVDGSGHLLVLGDAVHPLPPGSVQATAMTVEDAAVLGRLFSHLRKEDQISNFLVAFQDLRQPRCHAVMQKEAGILWYMTMRKGEAQQVRDGTMRARRDAGIGILQASDDIEESPEWVEIKEVFGYDAEDDADNWWVQWGLLRERAIGADVSYETPPITIKRGVR